MVCQLNSTYQLHLLGSISACFLKVLFNLYFSMFGYVVGTNDQNEQDELTRVIFWNIYYVMRFLTIIYVANTTSNQVSQILIWFILFIGGGMAEVIGSPAVVSCFSWGQRAAKLWCSGPSKIRGHCIGTFCGFETNVWF